MKRTRFAFPVKSVTNNPNKVNDHYGSFECKLNVSKIVFSPFFFG